MCALITSTFHDHVAEVEVGDEEGLDPTCAINCDNLFTLPKSVLAGQRGHLGPANQAPLNRALTIALGLAYAGAWAISGPPWPATLGGVGPRVRIGRS